MTTSSSSAAMNYEHQFLCRLAQPLPQLQFLSCCCHPPSPLSACATPTASSATSTAPSSLQYLLLLILDHLLSLHLHCLLLLPLSDASFYTSSSHFSSHFIASPYYCLLQLPFLLPPLAPPSLTSPPSAAFTIACPFVSGINLPRWQRGWPRI